MASWAELGVTLGAELGSGADDPRSGVPAICRTHDAALATRNLKDFQDTGIDVIDPWQAA